MKVSICPLWHSTGAISPVEEHLDDIAEIVNPDQFDGLWLSGRAQQDHHGRPFPSDVYFPGLFMLVGWGLLHAAFAGRTETTASWRDFLFRPPAESARSQRLFSLLSRYTFRRFVSATETESLSLVTA